MPSLPMLLAAASAVIFTGCLSTESCLPDEELFVVDEIVTEKDVTVMLQRWGLSDSSALECEEVCQYIYEESTGWVIDTVRTCALSVTDAGGTVQCEGDGIESDCSGL